MIKLDLNFNVFEGQGKVSYIQCEYSLSWWWWEVWLLLPPAQCERQKIQIMLPVSLHTVLVMEMSQFSFSSDNISLFCSPPGLILLVLC